MSDEMKNTQTAETTDPALKGRKQEQRQREKR